MQPLPGKRLYVVPTHFGNSWSFSEFSGSGKSKKLTLVLENREKDVEFCLSIKQWEPCLSKMMWLWNLSIVLLIVLLTD